MGIQGIELLKPELDTKNETETESPNQAHIVDRGDDPRPATTIVLEARIYGLPLTALCGHIFVPSRNPEDLPACPKCLETYEFARDFRGVEGPPSI